MRSLSDASNHWSSSATDPRIRARDDRAAYLGDLRARDRGYRSRAAASRRRGGPTSVGGAAARVADARRVS